MQSLIAALPEIEFVFPTGSYDGHLWIPDPPNGKGEPTTDPDIASLSVNALEAVVANQGPFYGILGYSQGGAFVTTFLSQTSSATFEVALIFCGYLPTTHLGLVSRIDAAAPFEMPSQAAERNKKRRMEKKSRNLNAAGKETTTTTTTSVSVGGGVSSSSGEKEETEDIEFVERTGAYGSYGANNDRFSIEDDEWATSQRAWNALAKHLEKFKGKKIWAPFYYDGKVKTRLKQAGFRGKVTHEKRDFFKLMNDAKFLANVDAIIDNPPYTGKGMKEKILTKLIAKDVPFCLLFPLGVLHSKFLRDLTAAKARRKKVQAIVPRRVFVHKEFGEELPFKYLVWLCYGLELERDLVLMDEE